jgi:S1-C subfamily serine protease
MKVKILLLSLLITGALQFSESAAQSDIDGARSVVKVKTSYQTTENGKAVMKIGNATGWCYQDSKHIITDLHVVAGIADKDIKVSTTRSIKTCGAKVVKVLKEADLALLELDQDLGCKPLTIEDVDPNSRKEYSIWGFPEGIFAVAGDDIRFARSVDNPAFLNDLIGGLSEDVTGGINLKRRLEEQQYPSVKAQIIRISSTISPGHSGAPIFTLDGKVVGIADGGLREGTARLNWAMPAFYYVPRLLASTDSKDDPKLKKPSIEVSLYSYSYTVDIGTTESEQRKTVEDVVKAKTITSEDGVQSLSRTWTAGYQDIIETMNDKDRNGLEKMMKRERFSLDMTDTQYDVYEDFGTGATFAIPFGENLQVSHGGGFNISYCKGSGYDSLQYSILCDKRNSYEEAVKAVDSIVKIQFPRKLWKQAWANVDSSDTTQTLIIHNFKDKRNHFGQIDAEVNGSTFLLVFIKYNGFLLHTDPVYLKKFYECSTAMYMTSFAKY